jgi:signal peptidase II
VTVAAAARAPSRWLLLALVAGFVLASDQVTKYLAVAHLTQAFRVAHAEGTGERLAAFVRERDLLERGLATPALQVFPSWWQLRYTQNRGAAWGFLSGARAWIRVPFFHLVTLGAIVFIVAYYRKLEESQRWLQVALALLLGGALGNGLDRVVHAYVIDFIDWHWSDPGWLAPSRHWPTFNVADCGVSAGLVMLFLEMFFARRKEPAAAPARAP